MTEKNTKLIKLLEDLGLEPEESAIYLALLDHGAMLPQHIARATGIKRTTLYSLFPDMIKSGLIIEVVQGKRRLLAPVSPDELFKRYENKYRELKQNMDELASLYRMQGLKPKIQIFEGTDQIKKLYLDTLETSGEILVYNSITKYRPDMLAWILDYYVPQRIKKGIKVKAIVTADEAGRKHMQEGPEFARVTRFVPLDKFPFRVEAMIYADKISFFTCEKNGPQVGIIIESKVITQTQRSIFALAWDGAAKYNK